MKTFLLLAVLLFASVARAGEAASEPAPPSLGTGTVAVVDGQAIPYDWFVHEFRSAYARQGGAPDARQQVFDEFLSRMILYAAALRSGVTNDPVAMAKIDRNLRGMEEFMRYQLAMARIGMIMEAYLRAEHQITDAGPASEEDAAAFYLRTMAGRSGAPPTYDAVPPEIKVRIREQAGRDQLEQRVRRLVAEIRTNYVVEINQPLVDQVPAPEMRGDVPPAFRAPALR